MIVDEEKAIEDGYNRTIGGIILDRRETAKGTGKDSVFIGDLGDDLQRRFFESGWAIGRLYEQASSQASSARGPG